MFFQIVTFNHMFLKTTTVIYYSSHSLAANLYSLYDVFSNYPISELN